MLRVAMTGLALIVLLSPALAQSATEITLKGKFVFDEDETKIAFKAGGRTIPIDLQKVRLQKHSVKKLKDVRAGTNISAFAKYTEWSDGDELERLACLVVGTHYIPQHRPKGHSMATWHSGPLRFNSNKTIAYMSGASIPTGVDRNVCVIEKASYSDFYTVKKSGKKIAKNAYVRGTYVERKIDGKKKKIFVPKLITLPTKGVNSREYKYILDPSKMYKDLGG